MSFINPYRFDQKFLIFNVFSTSSSWNLNTVVNSGDILTWSFSGPLTISPIVSNNPVVDLTGNTGTQSFFIENDDGFAGVTEIITGINLGINGIYLDKLTELTTFDTFGSYSGSDITFDKNTKLTILRIGTSNNTLDITNNTLLTELQFNTSNISSIDISNNTVLTSISCYSSNLTTLDISNNPLLDNVIIYGSNFTPTGVDDVIIQLDTHGLSNGVLNYNFQNPTSASLTAYNSLVGKGWTITGPVPV